MRKQIGDHDQVIKTYFIRVIETFGVFVGIFAVVVVVMGQGVGSALTATKDNIGQMIIVVIAISLTMTTVILVLLLGIKYLILNRDKK
jgi:hypothetical protein